MRPLIEVDNLSKKYIIRHQSQQQYDTLRDAISDSIRNAGKKLISPFEGNTRCMRIPHDRGTRLCPDF